MKWLILSIIIITIFYSGVAPRVKESNTVIIKPEYKMIYVVCSYHDDCIKAGANYYLITHTRNCGHDKN